MIGSSLEVSPANSLPSLAKANGARLVFINKEPCDLDSIADITLNGLAEEVLPQLLREIDCAHL